MQSDTHLEGEHLSSRKFFPLLEPFFLCKECQVLWIQRRMLFQMFCVSACFDGILARDSCSIFYSWRCLRWFTFFLFLQTDNFLAYLFFSLSNYYCYICDRCFSLWSQDLEKQVKELKSNESAVKEDNLRIQDLSTRVEAAESLNTKLLSEMTSLQAEKKTVDSSVEQLGHQIKQLNNQLIQKDDNLRNRLQQLELHFLSKWTSLHPCLIHLCHVYWLPAFLLLC